MINASACVTEADKHNYAVQYVSSFIPWNRYSELEFCFYCFTCIIVVHCYVMCYFLENYENIYYVSYLFSKIYLHTNFQDLFLKDTDFTVTWNVLLCILQ